MTLTTPGGNPTRSTSSAKANSGPGATSDALITTAQPAARAGPTLVAVSNISAFHGTTAATTPIGSRVVNTIMSGLSIGSVAPWILSARPP